MTATEPLPTIRKYREGTIDLETVTLKAALFDTSIAYSIDRVNHEFVSDVLNGTTANELDATSYARQGVTLPADAVTVDSVDNEVVFDADNVTWTNLDGGEEIQGGLIYVQIGTDDTTPGDDHIVYIDDDLRNSNGNRVTTNGSDVTLQIDAEGLINVA